MNNIPSDGITNLLTTFLNVQSRRAEITAGNIANADTAGFVAKELDFKDHLRDAARQAALPAARQADQSAFAPVKTIEQPVTAMGIDGNTVDVAQEMTRLAESGSNFNFAVKMLQTRMRLLRTAIREGK